MFATNAASRKVRNLERDPRATLALHDSRPGLEVCGASIRGRATIVRGDDADPLIELVHRRYVAEAGLALPAVAEFLEGDDVAVVLEVESATTWDGGRIPPPRSFGPGRGAAARHHEPAESIAAGDPG